MCGLYKMSLNRHESTLLILQKKANIPVSLTMHIPSAPVTSNNRLQDTKEKDFITINVLSIN